VHITTFSTFALDCYNMDGADSEVLDTLVFSHSLF